MSKHTKHEHSKHTQTNRHTYRVQTHVHKNRHAYTNYKLAYAHSHNHALTHNKHTFASKYKQRMHTLSSWTIWLEYVEDPVNRKLY